MYTLAKAAIHIDCPVPMVFAYAADLENFGDWFPGVIAVAARDELPFDAIGKRYAETVAVPLRGKRDVLLRVVDVKPPRRLVTEGDLPMVLPRMEIDVEDSGMGSCDVRWRMVSRNRSAVARHSILPIAGWLMRRRATTGLRTLKTRLEGQRA
ncbi:SRPBCC family protein [Mycobacterium sp. CVI_P3]|nr:SRPBCC family protein [Mycobacterium pinniadriaticum]MCX2929468.1 SRPBCC family protein [Mycobacterium pinniadriaticum]